MSWARAADAARSPEDEWETPLWHPIAEICILFDAAYVVMQRSGAEVVEITKVVATLFESGKQSFFEEPFWMRQVIESNILRPHHHPPPIAENRPRSTLRIKSGGIPIATDQRRHWGERFEVIENYPNL